MKSIKISTEAFAALLKLKPGELAWASKRGNLEGIPMPSMDRYGKFNLDDVMRFKERFDGLKNKFISRGL
ncbi:hypothetical protein I5M74_24610 [Serratia marcescens]|nr:hypothetical protein [Serratia marcescens]